MIAADRPGSEINRFRRAGQYFRVFKMIIAKWILITDPLPALLCAALNNGA